MKHGLTIRGDSLYCPLSLSLDSYWNCLNDCWHCYMRRLNHVWGADLRPTSPVELRRKLENGLKNPQPKSSIAWALKQKKTIRWGNKSDPFQPVEAKYRIAGRIFDIFLELDWPYVIQTMCTGVMMRYEKQIVEAAHLNIVQAYFTAGMESDWEILERKRTTPPGHRFEHLKSLNLQGVRIAAIGEPFIPGYHTVKQFKDLLKRLKSYGIMNYNVYNFHFNDFVAKRLVKLNIDIEKIWEYNQDDKWKPIQIQLCEAAEKEGISLGCPDFVNLPVGYRHKTNTCCGIDVPTPTTYNTHFFRNMLQQGISVDSIVEQTWDGIGSKEKGIQILTGKSGDFYTMADAGFYPKSKKGLIF